MKRMVLVFSLCLLVAVGLGGLPAAQPLPPELLYPLTVCPEGPPQCDFAAIQAAIEAAVPGAFILIYPGAYRENLILDKSLSLAATESGQIRIQGTPERETILTLQVDDEMNVLLEGITIVGLTDPAQASRGSVTHSTGVEIHGSGVLSLHLVGVQIINTDGAIGCFDFRGKASLSLDQSRLTANMLAIWPCGPEETILHLKQTVISGNFQGVLNSFSGDNMHLLIEDSLFIRNALAVGIAGQGIGAKNTEVIVRRSQFLNNVLYGISMDGDEGSRLEVRESLFWGDGEGVVVGGRATLEAYDNEFRGLQYALRMMLGTQVRLEGNTFEGNGDGIEVFSAGYLKEEEEYSLLEARGNRFVGNRGCGIKIEHVEAAMRALSIAGEGNEFSENGQDLCPPDYPWPEDFRKPRRHP